MSLENKIALRMPLVWIATDEPVRTAAKVAAGAKERNCYRLDEVKGLCLYTHDTDSWKPVVHHDKDTDEAHPIVNPQEAFEYLMKDEDCILISEYGEDSIKSFKKFVISTLTDFRSNFFSNGNQTIPLQIVFLSHESNPPDYLKRSAMKIVHDLPNKSEIEQIIHYLADFVSLESPVSKIAESSVGLSESEILELYMSDSVDNGSIEASRVNVQRKKILKNSNVLDIREPSLGMQDLGGLDNAKALIRQVAVLWNNPDKLEGLKIQAIRRLMMVGVPGVGKSLICEAIAKELNVELAKGGVSSSMNKFVGESEANIRRVFSTLKNIAPVVFWIDEFGRDMSGGQSSATVDGGTTDRVHGEFLTGIQELPDNVFLAAAANRIQDLAPEITRADRFDKIMFVGFPTASERADIFRIHLGEDVVNDYDLELLAASSDMFTGAEIKTLIKQVRFNVGLTHYRHPTTEEFVAHAPKMKGRIWVNHRSEILDMYRRAKVEWEWASSAQQLEADHVISKLLNPGSVSMDPNKKMKFGA